MKKTLWILWLICVLVVGGYYGYQMLSGDNKEEFLIGETTYGHYQIEMSCETCHTDAFGGQDAIQKACEGCHSEELERAHDSHPKKKFTDPREAYRLEILDGRYCVSCHTEHQQDQTHAMGVTLPDDYCFHCHQSVVEDRPSHKDLPFDSCATSGCHNFHDNRALYESFLVTNANQPWLSEIAKISSPDYSSGNSPVNIAANSTVVPSEHMDEAIHAEYASTAHSDAGVTCAGCHMQAEVGESANWIANPGVEQCQTCHANEADGFKKGKHGMRLNPELVRASGALSPADSHLSFKEDALEMHKDCSGCHSAHQFNTKRAAAEACLTCHNDVHSAAFTRSPHGILWQKELAGTVDAGSGVSCATCHMPRVKIRKNGTDFVRVEHNQNDNLRPNEKMIRSVCMDCHSLEFSIDALADRALIESNFSGKPASHIPSIDWALEREQ